MNDYYNFNLKDMVLLNRNSFYEIYDKILNNYKVIPYHSRYHGNDVMNFGTLLLKNSNLELSKIDLQTFILALVGHDIKHPGLGNKKEILEIEKLHPDKYPLENYHYYQTKILLDKNNIEYNEKLLKEVILSTNICRIPTGKYQGLELLAKVADINHCFCDFEKHMEWVNKLEKELKTKIDVKNQLDFLKNYANKILKDCKEIINEKFYKELEFKLKLNIDFWENKLKKIHP